MQTVGYRDILKISKDKGFKFRTFDYSIVGNYKSCDALFNHRDVPHFNHLHPNLAYGFGNEGLHYGEIASFIRYFKFLGFTFPIVTLMKDDTKNTVLETFSFFCFYFMKVNTETDLKNDQCESKITYYIGCKSNIILSMFTPFFKKMFKKSFEDYKNDDHPFLNRRGDLRQKGFVFDRDNSTFSFDSTINIQKQRCFFTKENSEKSSIKINLNEIKNNQMNKFGDIDILGFQIYRKDNFLHIFHRVCPHEGGDLDVNNDVGIKYTMEKFLKNRCRVRCNVHNRLFKPILIINLSKKDKKFTSKAFEFELSKDDLVISTKSDKKFNKIDWCA